MNIQRVVFAAVILFSVYGGANYYIARRLHQWLNLLSLNINVIVYACIFILIAFSLFLGFAPLPSGVKRIFSGIGSYWLGIFAYLLMFTALADIFVLLGRLVNMIPYPLPQDVLFVRGLAVLLLTAGVVSFGLYNANQFRVAPYEIEFKEAGFNGMRIALISDLHLGAANNLEKNLERAVKAINDLNPDIVCISGDIFNDSFNSIRDPDRAINLFRSIDAAYGVYACFGNHDGGSTLSKMMEFLEDSNIRLLNDEYVIIDGRLALFGRLDASPIGGSGELGRRDISAEIASVGANMPVVVMDHNPSHIDEYGSETDLILSGHTHRGQIFPGNLMTNAMYAANYGHYQKDGESPHVITSSGIGTWGPPMRIGSNSEIVSITIR